jgi:eukaryotic-like serine/threonine-protein kinase
MAEEADVIAGRYRLTLLLGRGGMGQVWKAHDEVLGRTVAVKEIRFPPGVAESEGDALRARLMREARLTARLNHPSITTTYDVVLEEGKPFIVMEYVEGTSLSEHIDEHGPLSTQRTAEIGLDLLRALNAAHEQGILHRDVKPANVLLSVDGRVVLTDFGIATSETDASLTTTGLLIGSPAYMSPERLRGDPTGPPTDLWSLGATLYSALMGKPPFGADTTLGVITSVLNDDVAPPSDTGPLGEAIVGMLAKTPGYRFRSEHVTDLLQRAIAALESRGHEIDDDARTTLAIEAPAAPLSAGAGEPMTVIPAVLAAEVDGAVARSAGHSPSEGPEVWPGLQGPSQPQGPDQPTSHGAGWEASEGPFDERGPAPGGLGAADAGAIRAPSQPAWSPPTQAGPAARSPGRRPGTRTMKAAMALLVVLAALAVGLLLLDNRDTGAGATDSPNGRGATRGQGPQTGSAPPSTSDPSTAAAPTSSPTTPASTSTTGSVGQTTAASDVPAGYSLRQDPLGFQVAVPSGWERRLDGATRVDFVSPDGSTFLRVDQRARALPDAARAWRDAEPAVAADLPGYERIRITPIEYRGWRGADWEFTWQGSGGTIHVLDRALVVPPKGWALYVSAPDSSWSSDGVSLLDAASSTFQPTS